MVLPRFCCTNLLALTPGLKPLLRARFFAGLKARASTEEPWRCVCETKSPFRLSTRRRRSQQKSAWSSYEGNQRDFPDLGIGDSFQPPAVELAAIELPAGGEDLAGHRCREPGLFGQQELVINPQQDRRKHAYSRDHPPHHSGLMFDLAEVVDQKSAELTADERADA